MIEITMRHIARSLVLIFISSLLAGAQNVDDKSAAIAVVNQLFAGMKAKDAEQIRSVLFADGTAHRHR
jgi:hypothetical protein